MTKIVGRQIGRQVSGQLDRQVGKQVGALEGRQQYDLGLSGPLSVPNPKKTEKENHPKKILYISEMELSS